MSGDTPYQISIYYKTILNLKQCVNITKIINKRLVNFFCKGSDSKQAFHVRGKIEDSM